VRLGHFLARELAPFPGRLRVTLRVVAGCAAALLLTDILGGGLGPHGHWTLFTVFTVSQADAGASLGRSVQRMIGTVAGGVLGILAVITLADLPALNTPLLAAVVAVGMFASLTSTVPYVLLLGTITFVLVVFLPPDAAATSAVDTGLWRIAAIATGIACGAGAQLLLWPDDPEDKLRNALAARLDRLASALAAAPPRPGFPRGAVPATPSLRLLGENLTTPLDLLANAETRHPALRRRHTEQLTVIVEVDRLLTSVAWLLDASPGWPASPGAAVGREIAALARECAELGRALGAGRAPAPSELGPPEETARDVPGLRPTLDDVRLSLERTRAALGFLDPGRPAVPALDQPPRRALFTTAFSTTNTGAMALALKAGLGVLICYVLMHALHWTAFITGGITVLVVSQTSVGATIQKSILRLAGAALGGLLGMAVIIAAMPNLENVGSLLVVAALGFAVAAWIMAGSSRISYMGLQTGMAFAMCVTDPGGPTTDLTTARDRVVGILIGVIVMMVLNLVLWPARARLAMRPALARALHSVAALARVAPEAESYRTRLRTALRLRSAVYADLAATLRLSDESAVEPDAETPAALDERQRMARLVAQTQAVFLSILALIRDRLSPDFPRLPATVQEDLRALDGGVADLLDALADFLERGRRGPLPDPAEHLAPLEAGVAAAPVAAAGATQAAVEVTAARNHLVIARDLVRQAAALRDALVIG
jgi:multidrug resistance protein MdtO